MWSWLNQINPNVVLPVVFTVGGWIWNRIRGEKKTDQRSTIGSVMDNFVYELLDKYSANGGEVASYLKSSRKYLQEHLWPALQKRGIKPNATTVRLVNEAIERGTAVLAKEVADLRRPKPNG